MHMVNIIGLICMCGYVVCSSVTVVCNGLCGCYKWCMSVIPLGHNSGLLSCGPVCCSRNCFGPGPVCGSDKKAASSTGAPNQALPHTCETPAVRLATTPVGFKHPGYMLQLHVADLTTSINQLCQI